MKLVRKSGDFPTLSQDLGLSGGEHWSGGEQLPAGAGKVGDFTELEVPAHGANPEQLLLFAAQAPGYSTLSFGINGQLGAATCDSDVTKAQPSERVRPGAFTPKQARSHLMLNSLERAGSRAAPGSASGSTALYSNAPYGLKKQTHSLLR